jgi:cation diffusion facilitator CzcD-associated flavoprotein CzcO
VAHKYELYRYIRFNTVVDSAVWSEADKKWKTAVSVTGGKDSEFGSTYTITSDFLISAVGQLNVPKLPDIPGLADFKGRLMHSARWDWSYNLEGKKIAVIGNGATAAQIIPEVAKVAGKLVVHQRTPNWVIPRMDAPIAPWKRTMFKYLPPTRWRYRAEMMDYREKLHDAIFDNQSPMARVVEGMSKDLMHSQLKGREDLWEKLQPKYKVGCKRVIISDDYFPVFQRDNVHLETGKIEKITKNGIQVDGKEEEYDLIILATGFRTVEFMHPIEITGLAGRTLASIWAKGGRALYCMMVESLPNFAMLYGPNSNLGHNSIILMIEAQSRYINALIKEVLAAKEGNETLVILPDAKRLNEFNENIQAKLQQSSFADPECSSWYKNEEGVITNNWSGTVVEYQKVCRNATPSFLPISMPHPHSFPSLFCSARPRDTCLPSPQPLLTDA